MGMPLELNTMIVTKNKEKKTAVENVYSLTKEGYRLYPVDLPVVEVRTSKSASPYALAKINKLTWANGETQLTYELVELMGVN